MAAKQKPAGAILGGVISDGLAKSAEAQRWEKASFTDNELIVLMAVMTKTPPKAFPAPKDIKDRVMALAKRQGVSVADAKAILRKAMTPGAATKAAAQPQPKRVAPAKDSPKHREQGQPPKHPAPGKKKASAKVASTGTSKRDIVLNAIKAPGGASLTTLMNLTGWQAHSVRGNCSRSVTRSSPCMRPPRPG